jgi:hypothetical protein
VPPGIELNAHTDDDGLITGSQWPRAIARFVLGEQTRMAAMARVLALRIRLPPQSRLPSSDSADTPTYRKYFKICEPIREHISRRNRGAIDAVQGAVQMDEPERPDRDAATMTREIIFLVALGVLAIGVTLTFAMAGFEIF